MLGGTAEVLVGLGAPPRPGPDADDTCHLVGVRALRRPLGDDDLRQLDRSWWRRCWAPRCRNRWSPVFSGSRARREAWSVPLSTSTVTEEGATVVVVVDDVATVVDVVLLVVVPPLTDGRSRRRTGAGRSSRTVRRVHSRQHQDADGDSHHHYENSPKRLGSPRPARRRRSARVARLPGGNCALLTCPAGRSPARPPSWPSADGPWLASAGARRAGHRPQHPCL